jgi:glycosyltransferase involved in cell wall biosynthesis
MRLSASLGMTVIVLSYNRPRWLAEALSSIDGASHIILVDDGSTFDVEHVARVSASQPVLLIANPPISVDRRLREPRVGRLLNRALQRVQDPFVTYLCDDDLFAPSWIPAAAEYLAEHPDVHMCRGEWNTLGTSQSSFTARNPWIVTTGNFAYRMHCVWRESCWWDEASITCHDAFMLTRYMNLHGYAHGGFDIPDVGVLAGWRREHAFNMLHVSDASCTYTPAARAMLDGGYLEDPVPEAVNA